MELGHKQSVAVKGYAIRHDREALGLSQEQLAGRCSTGLSVETLRRAERGHRIQRRSLESIAESLGKPSSGYLVSAAIGHDAGVPLQGRWRGFYVADAMGRAPYVTQECIEVTQAEGIYAAQITSEDPTFGVLKETLAGGEWRAGMFIGETRVESWTTPFGHSFFQLVPFRGHDWLDGFTTWYDLDSLRMECSRYIWVRTGSDFEDLYRQDAEQFIGQEVDLFTRRRAART